MSIKPGDTLPQATLGRMGDNGPETVDLSELIKGRKVVIFAVPAAFSSTCHTAHVPSFIRVKDDLAAKGVEDIICISVNDHFVMKAWAEATGGEAAGIKMLADADGAFTKSLGMAFDAPPVGFFGRSRRYAMLVEDGEVKVLNLEEAPGTCELSGGEAMLQKL
ncbi:peroxiredoxin [Rhodobacteraceae bacterium 2376]|uniref:Glutathione-dependent peroxiredoxin n=1 Tax=Rhabdonatronobacter sediminivivens TaxID=2743469 RepID=A0A7Z0KXL7_9RHOB|nr:peroxiredoxin [Rhabdonatronobacter sediminivivens]NYS23751.1 peroxiredoxin [Rhabdonatronobacter sediminivivens]